MNTYKIIYADPPWSYQVWSKELNSSAAGHYPTMKLENICNLKINGIADKDSVLFLWATAPNLEEAFKVISAWGFTYKTIAFTWIKQNKKQPTLFLGMGYYTRANAEFCLLATKGKPLKRISRSVRQVIISPIEEHSKKPDEARERIVELFGDLPRIELFARQKTDGWDVWGNEAPDGLDLSL